MEEEINDSRGTIPETIPLEFKHDGKDYSGNAIPIKSSCQDDICYEHDIELNKENLGVITCNVNGAWTSATITDQALIDAIGQELLFYYQP